MDCQIRLADGVAEVVIIGSLDSSWSSYLSERLDEVIRGGALEVRLDMAGVSYLSSNGIALLVRYHKQLRKIGGQFRVVADSEAVSHVLGLTGALRILGDDGPLPASGAGVPRCEVVEQAGMTLQVFPRANGAGPGRLELIGDPARLPGRGYDEHDEQPWKAVPGAAAFGLGALGPSFEACRGRFGEFLAVAGVAAYRPSAGPGRPDFEQAAGSFVPQVRLLYGLAFPVERASVMRFEAKGEPGGASVPLSQIAEACLSQAGSGVVGVVLAGETDGLVGAALRRSPVGLPAGLDPFAHPEVRDWLSLTPEHEHRRSTSLVVGVASSGGEPSASAVSPAAPGGFQAGTPGPLPRGRRPLPAASGRRSRAHADGLAPVRPRPYRDNPSPAERFAGDPRGRREPVHSGGHLVRAAGCGREGGVAMTLLIGSWTVGLILAVLALGVFISFRIFAFPDITADGSLTLGAAVAAALIVRGYSPWAATAASILAGAAGRGNDRRLAHSVPDQRAARRNSRRHRSLLGQPPRHGPEQHPAPGRPHGRNRPRGRRREDLGPD